MTPLPSTSRTPQLIPDVMVDMAQHMLLMPNLTVLLVGANTLTRDEFREKQANAAILDLTRGRNPRLRFQPFPR